MCVAHGPSREREREKERKRERQRQRYREKETDRDKRDKERERERERDRLDAESFDASLYLVCVAPARFSALCLGMRGLGFRLQDCRV